MGPCIVRIFQYISNKMQRYTFYYIWKLLYIFFGWYLHPSSGAHATICSIWYLSHRYCYLPLSWKSFNSYTISGNCCTCFGWYLHPSSGAHAAVSTASHICHTVTATCRYRGRGGTLPRQRKSCNSSTIAGVGSNGVTNNGCCI
jgi:hypothetical protein